jgi:thioredoxin-like negative regulator of GroEL
MRARAIARRCRRRFPPQPTPACPHPPHQTTPQQQINKQNKTKQNRCGPCRAIAPLIAQLAAKYPTVTFLSVDVDRCKAAAQKHGVSAMPTLQAYFGGQKVGECVGADPSRINAMAADLSTRAAGASAGAGGQTLGGGGVKPAATADELRARMAEAAERRARGE